MCGPSSSEKSLQKSSQNFSSMLQQNYGTLFDKQQGVLTAINRSLSPILAAGPSQRGFSAEERAALQTQAINSAGGANTMAQQAARTYGAGQGSGGGSGVTSGITKQIQAAIASGSAGQLGQSENQIAQADFAQGNQNYWRAQGGLGSLAAEYNPNATAGSAINENQASFGQAHEITEENNQMARDIAGGITSLASSALTFGAGAMSGGGLSGGLTALASGGKTNNYGG